jgi:NADH:ubiquinone oxidoreductase subunit F (NADH-binding)/NADH:ubiquinone oxidoreductase subunit E
MGSSSSATTYGSQTSGRETADIVEDLRNAQEQKGYIPPAEFEVIAQRRGLHVKDVHTVASFFPHFRLKPLARADVRVCDDMSCHLHGARQLREALELRFAGQADVLIRDVSCVGRCDHPCVVSVNEYMHQGADLATTTSLVLEELGANVPEREPHLPRSFAERGLQLKTDPYTDEASRYAALRKLVDTRDYSAVLNTLEDAELRGMGGAGFPAYRKWEAVRRATSSEKFVICNGDESEPGTIKDRFLLQHLPYLVLEGMIVCGLVTGAQRGYLYCRHEYGQQIEVLRTELARIYSLGLCGRNILGSDLSFELEVFVSPGGYICGEETALMEVIQGHRGEPRNKPPRSVTSGLWHKPTALNNVETFALASSILVQGPEWYKAQGRPGYPGLKFVGVTGGVVDPGVFEIPMGVTYRELIFDCAGGPPPGEEVIGFAPSGPSSGYLPASLLDTPLDWATLSKLGSMVGSGAVVVCTDRACMLDMAFNSVRFYRNESCGKCVPCRIGTQKMVEMLDGWMHGTTIGGDYALLEELSHTLKQTSICGLGQIAPVPIRSVMKHFPGEVRDHLDKHTCRAGVCFPNAGARR